MLVFLLAVALSAAGPRPVDWKAMIPTIRSVLKAQFPDERVGEDYPVGIERPADIADITGDGISEALVWLGTGGASTEEMTLMRMEADRPVVAFFKGRDGKVRPLIFLRGASVIHSDGIDMLPKENAVYSSHYAYYSDRRLRECGCEAYQWNPRAKIFDYAARLSKKLTQDICRKAPSHN